jgi:transketolase
MPISTMLGYDDLPDLLTRLDGDEKHDWAALSTLDVVWVLYDRVLRVTPETADDPERDRFLLSKGHGPAAYYAVLAAKGFVEPGALALHGEQRVVCLVGDAELDEGSNWEAVQYAGRIGLGRLTVVVVDNRSATYGWPGGLGARFALEGWDAEAVDGRDHAALERALARRTERPNVVIAEVAR